ncbi:MAG: S-methyl-5-thioribose-1-phosphate isomerase [Lachnospiraceae bacterium]|nr:S-methyl-5-thioribose-1-phosphate isomerase [Lachnospiraceae bacterium]
MEDIKNIDTVDIDIEEPALLAIDQRLLPNEVKILRLKTKEEIYDAIKTLAVRGAPAIGVGAAIGMYVVAEQLAKDCKSEDEFFAAYKEASDYINSSRPTAVNLSWALKRMEECLDSRRGESRDTQLLALRDEAITIKNEDIEMCRKIGEYGVELIHPGDGILTHCNAGRLATVRYGTATSPIYQAHERGMDIHVYCDETRPLLQGARLTSYELFSAGIDTTLICDGMSASLMRDGRIQMVIVGCDRVAANGDVANKIGTSMVAAVAKYYGVPFYVAGPGSTIDMSTPTGRDIVIEQRDGSEVTDKWYERPMAPAGVGVYNPAFDVTDHELIAGIITEKGILRPPYTEALKKIFG